MRQDDKPLKETWPSSPSIGNPAKRFQEGIRESSVHFKEVIQAVLRRTDLKRMEQAAQRLGGGRGRRVPPSVESVPSPLPPPSL